LSFLLLFYFIYLFIYSIQLTFPCLQTNIDEYNWMAWNQRVLRNDLGIAFPSTAQTDILRFWLPFTEPDGPYAAGHDVLTQCNSGTFGGTGGCCSCTDLDAGRYGNAGLVDETADAADVGIWLVFLFRASSGRPPAFVHQAPPGAYNTGGSRVSDLFGFCILFLVLVCLDLCFVRF
jgi:hypothetical protein